MKRREKKATAEANGKAEGAGHEQEGEGKLSKREARRLHKERRKKEVRSLTVPEECHCTWHTPPTAVGGASGEEAGQGRGGL